MDVKRLERMRITFHRVLPVKLTNQLGRYYHMTFQNGGSHRKLFLDRRKRSQFDHIVVRKAMLIYYAYVTSMGYINRLKKDAAFQEIHVFDHIFLIIVPLLRTLPGALWLQNYSIS